MRELKRNPNVRQPYSDVAGDLDRLSGDLILFVGDRLAFRTEEDKEEMRQLCERMDWICVRARAVLDPASLTEADWILAEKPMPPMSV